MQFGAEGQARSLVVGKWYMLHGFMLYIQRIEAFLATRSGCRSCVCLS